MAGLWPSVITVRHPSGTQIVLRSLRGRDRDEWEHLRAANLPWLTPWEATSPYPVRTMTFRQLVRHQNREAEAGRMQPFVIEEAGHLIGQMHLFGITWGAQRSGAAGYWVAESAAGRGIAPLALAALIDHAFVGLGLHRVEVNIRPDNVASLRVVEKLGLRDEGVRRAFLHIDGAWRDHRTFAILADEAPGGSLVGHWNRQWSQPLPDRAAARPPA